MFVFHRRDFMYFQAPSQNCILGAGKILLFAPLGVYSISHCIYTRTNILQFFFRPHRNKRPFANPERRGLQQGEQGGQDGDSFRAASKAGAVSSSEGGGVGVGSGDEEKEVRHGDPVCSRRRRPGQAPGQPAGVWPGQQVQAPQGRGHSQGEVRKPEEPQQDLSRGVRLRPR